MTICQAVTMLMAAAAPALAFALTGECGEGCTPLVSFDASAPRAVQHRWVAVNDPVMGGKSTSTVTVENGVLNFTGVCAIVPKLQAPGFITAVAGNGFFRHDTFVDVSTCTGLEIQAKDFTEGYTGYRISFGTAKPPGGRFFAQGYKADLHPTVGSFGSVKLPFTSFTDFWDDASGKALHTCAENKEYCPDKATLRNMKTMSIWAEGVEGAIHLEVKSISGYGCSGGALEQQEDVPETAAAAPDVVLATFDGEDSDSTFKWSDMNDPVMGGSSTSSFRIDQSTKAGVFNGTCAIVKFLKAPGFAKITTQAGWFRSNHFRDASKCLNSLHGTMDLLVRSTTPQYQGFRLGWAAKGVPHTSMYGGGSFKAGFSLQDSTDWQTVKVPFSSFSYDWSGYTGRCDTKDPNGQQHHCCGAGAAAKYCPTAEFLGAITDLEVWAEGIEGDFHLEIRWIGASA